MEQIIQITPAFERGTEGGRGSAHIWFCLRGPNGAVTFMVLTDWYLPETKEIFEKNGWEFSHSSGGAVSTHATWPYEPWQKDTRNESCEWLDGAPCYGDIGFLIGDDFFAALVEGGTDALWDKMQKWYDEIPTQPEPDKIITEQEGDQNA